MSVYNFSSVKRARHYNYLAMHYDKRAKEYAEYRERDFSEFVPRLEKLARDSRGHRDWLIKTLRKVLTMQSPWCKISNWIVKRWRA